MDETPSREISISGYCYPYISEEVLNETLPFLTFVNIFAYGFTTEGELIDIDDEKVLSLSRAQNVAPIMVLTTLTSEGSFSNILAHQILNNESIQDVLIENLLRTLREKQFYGLDIDFEYVLPEDRDVFSAFVRKVTNILNQEGYIVTVALAPKTSSDQVGLLYESHDYYALGQAANWVLLMTYEWGYTYGYI